MDEATQDAVRLFREGMVEHAEQMEMIREIKDQWANHAKHVISVFLTAPGKAKVRVKSPVSGTVSVVRVKIGPLHNWAALRKGNIQALIPELGENDRELLLTGYTAEDWFTLFGDGEG